MPVRLRLVVAALAGLAALGAIAYTFYWFHMAAALRKGIDEWSEARRTEGWTVELDGLTVDGFPSVIRAQGTALHLASPGGFEWRTGRLSAHASPFDLSRVHVDLPGRHELAFADLSATVTASAARAMVHFLPDGSKLDDATVTAADLAIAPSAGQPLRIANLAATLDPLETLNPGHDTPTVAVIAAAQGVELPSLPGLVMDPRIALIDLKFRVLGAIPPGAPLDALAAWSAGGGTVEIDRFALEWAPLALEAEGTLAFDSRLQPLAAMTARIRGYGEFTDRLAQAGMVEPGAASAARLLLGLMSKPDPRGRPALPVPLTLQDGFLSVGPVRVLKVPPLPAAAAR
jgi:hypothetical protein